MNVVTMSKRFAATGAVAALATTGLVGLSTTAAHADPVVTNTYSCSAAGTTFPVGLTTNAVGIEGFPTIAAGFTVPAGLLTVTNTFTIPDQVHSALGQFQVTSIAAPTFAGDFGGNQVHVAGISVTLAGMTQNADTSWSSDSTDTDGDAREGDGVNEDFVVPQAGVYDIFSPSSLDLVATTASGGSIPVSCTLAPSTTAGAYHHITVTKNKSATAEKVLGKMTHTKATKIKATVTTPGTSNKVPSGMVIVKKGSKTLGKGTLNAKGIATINLGKLKKGVYKKVVTVYKGDGYTTTSKSAPAKFTIK
ncbi:Ig-like domain repeat protein [Nocardioides sp. KIGAM211]|uniref:Ig-like domain repeat protein n=1 Tax=Nocardioides luti TaxID=2761101 RepID=A0A7X0RIK7_9ACTN|nr:Ig-like domain repeat protein [Nocardioides luti]MBB6628971.1 Ig-like domain repeat protein [Nocardioides luti]